MTEPARTMRVNINFPAPLVADADALATERGEDRSSFLIRAARREVFFASLPSTARIYVVERPNSPQREVVFL